MQAFSLVHYNQPSAATTTATTAAAAIITAATAATAASFTGLYQIKIVNSCLPYALFPLSLKIVPGNSPIAASQVSCLC